MTSSQARSSINVTNFPTTIHDFNEIRARVGYLKRVEVIVPIDVNKVGDLESLNTL